MTYKVLRQYSALANTVIMRYNKRMNSPESRFTYQEVWDIPDVQDSEVVPIGISDRVLAADNERTEPRYIFDRPGSKPGDGYPGMSQEGYTKLRLVIEMNFYEGGAITPFGYFLFSRALIDYQNGVSFFIIIDFILQVAQEQETLFGPTEKTNISKPVPLETEELLESLLSHRVPPDDFVQ